MANLTTKQVRDRLIAIGGPPTSQRRQVTLSAMTMFVHLLEALENGGGGGSGSGGVASAVRLKNLAGDNINPATTADIAKLESLLEALKTQGETPRTAATATKTYSEKYRLSSKLAAPVAATPHTAATSDSSVPATTGTVGSKLSLSPSQVESVKQISVVPLGGCQFGSGLYDNGLIYKLGGADFITPLRQILVGTKEVLMQEAEYQTGFGISGTGATPDDSISATQAGTSLGSTTVARDGSWEISPWETVSGELPVAQGTSAIAVTNGQGTLSTPWELMHAEIQIEIVRSI